MLFTRKYNLINNLTGWAVFVIALLTYWLTLEPTVSYWDCGEFISQADKLEIGHPPGNPIFMLTARFFSNFAFGNPMRVALMVNAMSGLLSALTILLLFWTITHLAGKLLIKGKTTEGMTTAKYLAIMGSGVVGALAYAWSDTFWFSAVEGEVYAFSSFCTALVFWLILKWENRAEQPHSDRYLVLIAYIIGVSIAVHLLNLLCIPAIVLVFAYKKWSNLNVKKSLLALLVSFAIIVLVLYGLVPGFIKVSGWFDIFAVNTLNLPFNSGVGVYTVLAIASFVWALWELHTERSHKRIRISVFVGALFSGMLFIASWVVTLLLLAVLAYFMFFGFKKLPVRWLNLAMWSIFVIFIGYSSYALILIRAHANPPLNQSAPDNVLTLSSYLSREQYGETPLLYGPTYQATYHYVVDGHGDIPLGDSEVVPDVPDYRPNFKKGKANVTKGVPGASVVSPLGYMSADELAKAGSLARRGGDYYVTADYESDIEYAPSMNMLFPRIHSHVPSHKAEYELWVPSLTDPDHEATTITAFNPETGQEEPLREISQESLDYNEALGQYYFKNVQTSVKPTFAENLQFFFNYQINHMYWRYFLWNFAGRQNDYNNQRGEKDLGNWITGFSFWDNARLGDQSLLPDALGEGNAGHNVFYCLPLILGLLGLFWQAFRGKEGIEQFWVVFFFFFMTGIAIVLYLNQPPMQPRERDYAFAGSFYAFAIWIGLGVSALWKLLILALEKIDSKKGGAKANAASTAARPAAEADEAELENSKIGLRAAIIACVLGLVVPVQMVSQTWDDHDRSGRYAAHDYAIDYLESLEPNAIIFCNGDNDTFPLWYAQEVEGVRPDVKIINLSYLQSDWYVNQQRLRTYDAPPVKLTASPADIAYNRLALVMADGGDNTDTQTPVTLINALKALYSRNAKYNDYGYIDAPYTNTYIPVDKKVALQRGLYNPEDPDGILDQIPVDLSSMSRGQISLSQIMMLDIIATNAANGWQRPIYWALTVGSDQYEIFAPYLRNVGMAYQLVPYVGNAAPDPERSYNVIKNKYRWGGADAAGRKPYFDETAGRMASGVRMTAIDLSSQFLENGARYKENADKEAQEGNKAGQAGWLARSTDAYKKCIEMLDLVTAKIPASTYPFTFLDYYTIGLNYCDAGKALGDKKAIQRGLQWLKDGMMVYGKNVNYVAKLIEKYGSAVQVVDGQSYSVPYMPAVSLSQENKQILALYYRLIDAYEEYAGANSADAVLKQAKVKLRKQLKSYYDLVTTGSTGYDEEYAGSDGASASPEDLQAYIRQQILSYVDDIKTMQQADAATYATIDPNLQSADSLFYYLVMYYGEQGGDVASLEHELDSLGVNLTRSKELYDAFERANPDLFQR